MNCANHPEVSATAYCQNCGKPLCQECVRSVGGVIYCEPCLAARMKNPSPGVPGNPVYVGPPPIAGPNPGLALALGLIPGVGAMYNGQFVKGFVHVLVFAVLASFSSHESFFGILIPFWIAYQVFDAYQTARARRDGLPLPNPFGLNDLGFRLGLQPHPEGTIHNPPTPDQPVPPGTPTSSSTYTPASAPFSNVGSGFAPGAPPAAGFVPPPGDPRMAPPSAAYSNLPGAPARRDIPVGAVVLIGLGVLFLLGTLGIFQDDWISRAWPLLIVGIGVWLVVRRTRDARANAPGGKAL